MSKAKIKQSRILDTVAETMNDLHRLGFIDKRKQEKIEWLCMQELPAYNSEKIKSLRQQHNLSQTVFASLLNTSASTVRQWEIGEKHPSGASQKLLNLLERKGLEGIL
jgi:putative transcriptional regulator